MDSEARVNVHLKNCCKLIQGRYRKVNSQVVNATNKIDVNNAENDHMQARHSKKKKTEQLSLGNGRVMELKLIKSEAPERLSRTLTQRRGWSKEF